MHIEFALSHPLVDATLAHFRNGRFDATTQWDGRNFWRAMRTPDGPATLHIEVHGDRCIARATGPGASNALGRVPWLIGMHDAPVSFTGCPPVIARTQRKFGLLRIGASLDAYHELLPAVLGQRVTAGEAVSQWRRLCCDFGSLAPALDAAPALFLPPDPQKIANTPYWAFHRYGIDRRRAEALRNVARYSDFLDRISLDASSRLTESLQHIPGVGQWTAAVAGLAAFGDADALCVGDFHAKNTVVYAFTGRHRGSDEEMCGLLAPFAPHRARILRWLELDGLNAPAHGPRRRNLSIAHL